MAMAPINIKENPNGARMISNIQGNITAAIAYVPQTTTHSNSDLKGAKEHVLLIKLKSFGIQNEQSKSLKLNDILKKSR